jgi:hypothetical protein
METLGLSMELNDDILVQTTFLQTIARVKRVKSRLLQKVAQKMRALCSHLLRLFAWYVRFHSLNASNSLQGDRFVLKSDCREQILQNLKQ